MAGGKALTVKIGADTRGLNKGLRNASGMIGNFGSNVGKLGLGLGAAAGMGLGAGMLVKKGYSVIQSLTPYSEDLAKSYSQLANTNEEVKGKIADNLVPAVDAAADAWDKLAPVLADAANTLLLSVSDYANWVTGNVKTEDMTLTQKIMEAWANYGAAGVSFFSNDLKGMAYNIGQGNMDLGLQNGFTVLDPGEAGEYGPEGGYKTEQGRERQLERIAVAMEEAAAAQREAAAAAMATSAFGGPF